MTGGRTSPARDESPQRCRSRPDLHTRLWKWIDQRTGASRILRDSLDEPIPGGARFAYVFGSALLFIFVSQIVTGTCLALYYVPAPMVAHVSVAYIVKAVTAGSFLRSLHSYGSSAMVVVLLLHLLQTVLYGSYKGRREFLWISGCTLSLLVLGMAFTGYLLPWDQKAYFAGSVGTDLVGQVPFIGEGLRLLLRGGPTMGALTISRFYVLHLLIIPGLVFAFIAVHVVLFRRAGAAGPTTEDPFRPQSPTETFFPKQVLIDLAFVALVMGVLGMLAHFRPVPLGPEANPDIRYLPRPEWYFLPMFQWLKYWEGGRTVIGIVIIPVILTGLLFLLPFMDRGLQRRPWRRPLPVGAVVLAVVGLLWLGMTSHLDDSRDPAVAAQLAQQSQEEATYTRAAFIPYPASSLPEGAASTPIDSTAAQGKAIFESQRCRGCHGESGTGGVGPALTQISSRLQPAPLAALLKAPTAKMKAAGMVPLTLNDTQMKALVSYLASLGGTPAPSAPALPDTGQSAAAAATAAPQQDVRQPQTPPAAATASPDTSHARVQPPEKPGPAGSARTATASSTQPGEALFDVHGCPSCHGAGGVGTARAPALTSLSKTLTPAELTRLLQHPTQKMTSGGMPPVTLNGTDLGALVAYLQGLGGTPAAPPAAAATSPAAPTPGRSRVDSSRVATLPPQPPLNELESKGESVFKAHGCADCHGVAGVAGTAAAPALAGRGADFTPEILTAMLRHPTTRMQQGGMPAVSLSSDDLKALVAYIRHVAVSKTDNHSEGGR